MKRSAKTRQALAEDLQRPRPKKRSAVLRRKPRQRKRQRRFVCSTVHDVLAWLMVYVGCKSRGKEGENCGCQRCEEGTPRCESRGSVTMRRVWVSAVRAIFHFVSPHSLVITVADGFITFVLIALYDLCARESPSLANMSVMSDVRAVMLLVYILSKLLTILHCCDTQHQDVCVVPPSSWLYRRLNLDFSAV